MTVPGRFFLCEYSYAFPINCFLKTPIGQKDNFLFLLQLGYTLRHQNSRLYGLHTPGLRPVVHPHFPGLQSCTESCTICFPGSVAFGLGLSHTTSIPGSPACRSCHVTSQPPYT
jgi:hypothetical protein